MIRKPQRIHHAKQARQLQIHWSTGEAYSLNSQQLRAACRCASCRAHQVRGELVLIPQDLQIERINNQGSGLQLVFSDGHERGIFPWQYLFELGVAANQTLLQNQ